MPSIFANLCRQLVKLPTRYHLWCAEMELRLTTAPSPDRKAARDRCLDLLRDYRQRGEYPKNIHDPAHLSPCFIDSKGTECAVAHLMLQTGAEDAVANVAKQANFARIKEMHFPELDQWASDSGLTKAEVARIQPGYGPTRGEVDSFAQFIYPMTVVAAIAMTSILFNTVRLVFAFRPRITTISAGFASGIILLIGWLSIDSLFRRRLGRDFDEAVLIGLITGVLSIACSSLALWFRRGKWRPSAFESEEWTIPAPNRKSENVKDMKRGDYREAN